MSHWSEVWAVVTSCPQAHKELPLLPSALINPPRYTFANRLPQITQLHPLLQMKGHSTVGACLGQSQPEPGTGMGQPGPDSLLFPLVDALVPWQLLTPNSCGESIASEQLRSPRTSGLVLGLSFPPKNPSERMCL